MKSILALATLALLGACTAAQVAQVQEINSVVCQKDAALQPVIVALAAPLAVAVVPTASPAVAGAVALDTTMLHPDMVALCAQLGAVPVAGK